MKRKKNYFHVHWLRHYEILPFQHHKSSKLFLYCQHVLFVQYDEHSRRFPLGDRSL